MVLSPASAANCSTIAQDLASNGKLSVVLTAVKAAGLEAYFSNPDLEVTVFAPFNGAFIAALRTYGISASQLLSNKAVLLKILQNHVIPGAVLNSTALAATTTPLTSLAGQTITVSTSNGTISLTPEGGGPARIITPDLAACKSIVQVIDYVLLPVVGAHTPPAGQASPPPAAVAPASAPATGVTAAGPATATATPPTSAATATVGSAVTLACGLAGAAVMLLA